MEQKHTQNIQKFFWILNLSGSVIRMLSVVSRLERFQWFRHTNFGENVFIYIVISELRFV